MTILVVDGQHQLSSPSEQQQQEDDKSHFAALTCFSGKTENFLVVDFDERFIVVSKNDGPKTIVVAARNNDASVPMGVGDELWDVE